MSGRVASIRGRLSRVLLALGVVWALLLPVAVGLGVRHEVHELLDDALAASADVLLDVVPDGPARGDAVRPGQGRADTRRFAWQVVDARGTVLQRSIGAPTQPLAAVPPPGFADAPAWRVHARALGANVLYVAQSHAERREVARDIGMLSAVSALLLGLLSVWWVRSRVAHELAPLEALPDLLARFDPLVPDATLGPPAREELRPVHDAVEQLGRRLAQRVAGERAFAGHAAHALRTPLAGIDAQLAIALRESPPALQARLQRMREATGRLQRVVAALLALFRTGVELHPQAVDLAALADRLLVAGLDIRVVGEGALRADPDLLAAALLNVLDNSLRCGATQVELSVQPHGVRVQDNGPGVTDERRSVLQQALAQRAYDGRMGLGLMLADLVARAHGGVVTLPAPAVGGFVVEIGLGPAAGSPR